MLITFEGLPGAGKSTQSRMLARCLEASGQPVIALPDLATLDTDPVAATLVDLLRTSGDPFLRTGDAITDTMITAAIRADLVATVLDPALAENLAAAVVIEDRGIHTMASYAIAVLLRQHRATDVALDWLDALTALAGPRPTRALWLRVPPRTSPYAEPTNAAETTTPYSPASSALTSPGSTTPMHCLPNEIPSSRSLMSPSSTRSTLTSPFTPPCVRSARRATST